MKLIFLLLFFLFIMNFIENLLVEMYLYIIMIFMLIKLIFFFSLESLGFLQKIYYIMGMDKYSWGLIMLSVWILIMVIMTSSIMKFMYFYLVMINILLMLLMLCFLSMSMIMFYIYFESSLIPIFILILGWGGQVERIQASFYMMLYTLFGSMPLFMMINLLMVSNYSLMMDIIMLSSQKLNLMSYLGLMMAFFIKMPMFFMHLWLPKAHVEAPLVGSMVLAGVMLKLGSYGLMRVMLMMEKYCLSYNKIFIIISMLGAMFASLICLNQIDIKMLVAYSSVVHMGLLMSGMMTLFNWGYLGGFLMMISHGLCSSGLFMLVNINYERLMSRSLFISKGMINNLPIMSMFWFLLCSSNLSFPPSLNLLGEIMLFNSLLVWSKFLMLNLGILSFLGAAYNLYMYSYSQHGKLNSMIFVVKMVKVSEMMGLLLHWLPLNLLFLLINVFI